MRQEARGSQRGESHEEIGTLKQAQKPSKQAAGMGQPRLNVDASGRARCQKGNCRTKILRGQVRVSKLHSANATLVHDHEKHWHLRCYPFGKGTSAAAVCGYVSLPEEQQEECQAAVGGARASSSSGSAVDYGDML